MRRRVSAKIFHGAKKGGVPCAFKNDLLSGTSGTSVEVKGPFPLLAMSLQRAQFVC
jgi:hypothetical protein